MQKKKAGQIRMMTRRQTNKDQGESTHTHTHNPVRSLVIMKSLLKSNIWWHKNKKSSNI